MGWIAGPRSLISRLTTLQSTLGTRPEPVLEGALRELIEEGTLASLARKLSMAARERREALLHALEGPISLGWPAGRTAGGALWMPTGNASAQTWAKRLETPGIRVRPGRDFDHEGRDLPFLHLPFMAQDPEELAIMASRILELRPQAPGPPPGSVQS
jgi:DNA-binding transcriptional MocR family regulator